MANPRLSRPCSRPPPGPAAPAPAAASTGAWFRRAAPPDRGRMVPRILLLLCLGVTSCHAGNTEPPTLETTWQATYNATGPVTQTCGKHYASFFLQQFLMTRDRLHNICGEDVKISIASLARVRIYHNQIHLTTFLYLNGINMSRIYDCVQKINSTFQNVQSLANVSTITEDKTLNCSQATMSTPVLGWDSNGCRWTCKNAYTLLGQESACYFPTTPHQELGNCTDFSQTPGQTTSTTTTTTTSPTTTTETTTPTTTTTTTTTSMSTSPTVMSTPMPTASATTANEPTTTMPSLDWHVQVKDTNGIETSTVIVYEGQCTPITLNISIANVSAICEGQTVDCQIYIKISFERKAQPKCGNTGESIDQVVVGETTSSGGLIDKDNFCNLDVWTSGGVPVNRSQMEITVPLCGRIDFNYDGNQTVPMTLSLQRNTSAGLTNTILLDSKQNILDKYIPQTLQGWTPCDRVKVIDMDQKATCQSINDPHLTTFDTLQYNNFRQGEFIMYKHTVDPIQINIVYQNCSITTQASCNCAVAVKVGDDVILIDRCFRKKKPLRNINGTLVLNNKPILELKVYLNGDLTPGTKIYQEDEGLKYYIYLPTGTCVKVMTSGELLNVWVIASPYDWKKTVGLCGTYDGDILNDTSLPNGTVLDLEDITNKVRPQPREFIEAMRIPRIYGPGSLLLGVPASSEEYMLNISCICARGVTANNCHLNQMVDMCNLIQGKDVTDYWIQRAETPRFRASAARRRRRELSNTIPNMAPTQPIEIDANFIPPDYNWENPEEKVQAHQFCDSYIRNSTVGRLCATIPNVNFDQEVQTCAEDIQITKSKDWADSAESAMEEQCLEELRKNSNIDSSIADQINGAICINKCNNHGQCVSGQCVCDEGYTGADCSSSVDQPPAGVEMRDYGLCDVQINDCRHILVYGENFINSQLLVCLLVEAIVQSTGFTLGDETKKNAKYINFNAVQCSIEELKLRPYLISVSNDDGKSRSEPLLFIPYNSTCLDCSTNETSCKQVMDDWCVIGQECFSPTQRNPQNECEVCQPTTNKGNWTAVEDCDNQLSDVIVATIAAVVGAVVGVALGVLLYYFICCRRSSSRKSVDDYGSSRVGHNGFKPPTSQAGSDGDWIHRDPGLHSSQFPQSLDDRPHQYRDPYLQDYGEGVENGVDDTTYF